MPGWLWVGIGGFLGSAARYGIAMAWPAPAGRFPWATFAVNAAGCLAIGLVAGLWARNPHWHADLRLLLATGVLGGFTTFSAFGLEAVTLLRSGNVAIAAAYVAGSVVLGLGAAAAGMLLVRA